MFVRGRSLLIKPASFLDHLEGREGLLGLIVIVEMPRQISEDKQEDCYRGNNPERPPVFEQAFCHVERKSRPERSRTGRDISHCEQESRSIGRLRYAPLGMTVRKCHGSLAS